MPICKRDGFDTTKNNATFHDNDEVFFCEVTKEIFRDYEDYFRHVMIINSTVWQCEATGRENLTYAEALRSERRARKKMELFKDSLRPPVMMVIEYAKQSSLNVLSAMVFKFIRNRYFFNEQVSAAQGSVRSKSYTVMEIIPPGNGSPSPNEVYGETNDIQYKLREVNEKQNEIIVPFQKVKRNRSECTLENLQMFIKNNVTRVDGILRPDPTSYKKYVTDRNITFSMLFIGKMPHFTPAKIKRPQNETNKKQSTIKKYLSKNDEEKNNGGKLSAEDQAKQKEKADKEKAFKEELERLRREKQEQLIEMERQRIEKRAQLMAKIDAECTALLTKTDDLERTDQRALPKYSPIQTLIPLKLLGDAFMLREFMHTFAGVLSGIDVFSGNLSFYEMSRAFTTREVAGPLSDILLVLLGTIFDLQKGEEEECTVAYLKLRKELRTNEILTVMGEASRTHFYSKRHYSFSINELPIDSLTLSEVLRLHLLSSGAFVKDRVEKWRILYRNGYNSSEDPGLHLRMQYPHIMRALKMYTVFQLPLRDVMRILRCLMSQILTYSSTIATIEERIEESAKARAELRTLASAKNRRLDFVQIQKRNLTTEYHMECMKDETKDKDRKRYDALNKKIAEVMAQSDREQKKYEQQVQKLHGVIFNYLVSLGMDRAYRKYYALESIPGIFIEHPPDCMDTCLECPPQNDSNIYKLKTMDNFPNNRKDLRNYLLKFYTDQEKKAAELLKANPNVKLNGISQENKENQENLLLNGIVNGHDDDTKEAVRNIKSEPSSTDLPSQYELYMCTGDPHNCIVHDERNQDRQRWAYIHDKDDIEKLINSLNPKGEREAELRNQLITMRVLIEDHLRKCPVESLSIDNSDKEKFTKLMMNETYRKYNNANLGCSEGDDLNEVMQTSLIDYILRLENDVYTGDLGSLKVKDLKKWRSDVRNGSYDPQGKLQWGSTLQKSLTANAADDEDDNEDYEDDEDVDGGKFANSAYRDPGETLGDTLEIDSEDSEDEGISLHDSGTLRSNVNNIASALLQVEQGIQRRFLKEPFGPPARELKDKELLERKMKAGANRLKQWEVSLMHSTSYSQVFLHLNILHDCILWNRSTNKSLCQICRRGSEPNKMLLCDECNGGMHMFCMKPPMIKVPEGNWYCTRCVKRLGLVNENSVDKKKETAQKRKRKFNVEEEENSSDTSSISSTSASASASASASVSKHNSRQQKQQRISARRTNKRIQSEEIADILEEDEENEDEEPEELSEDKDDMPADEESDSTEEKEEDDENVCIICSYDGSDLMCVRCNDSFHLECVNLKRPPRYNFMCSNCKTKEEKKRKAKTKDNSSDDDDDDEASEPLVKRSRQGRFSLRNTLTVNGKTNPEKSGSQRRSHRRTGDSLPLDNASLYELLTDVMKHKQAWPFLRPVTHSEVPDYHKIIKNPMDFAKVKSKLNMGTYQLNEEVMNDIQLIFNNCEQYNIRTDEIYQAGEALEKFIINHCKKLNLPYKPSDMH